ncbi:MAG: AIM24 family protein, partial [Thermoplasmata archaeon]
MNCPTCGQPGTFYPQYNRYYCHKCAKYIEAVPPPPTSKPETKPETKPEMTQAPTTTPPQTGTAPSTTQQTIQQGRNWHIEGHIVPTIVVNLAPGESIKVQPGAMMSRDPTVAMETGTQGGLGKALTMKFLAGESLSIVTFTGPGQVRITGGVVGKIEAIQLQGYPIRVRGGAFIAAETTVDMDVQMERIGTAIIGGTGLFQIRMFGYGTAFIQSSGDIISGYLHPGQSIIVDEEHFLACDEAVQRVRERVQGLRN